MREKHTLYYLFKDGARRKIVTCFLSDEERYYLIKSLYDKIILESMDCEIVWEIV